MNILTSEFSKRKLNKITLLFITLLIRGIINTAISFVIYTRFRVIDFTLQLVISIFLVLKTDWIYYNVKKYEDETMKLSSYFIDNYTVDNLRIWKRKGIMVLGTLSIVYLIIIPIDSYILIEYIVQFIICYLIVDNIENGGGVLYNLYYRLQDSKVGELLNSSRLVNIYTEKDIIILDDVIKMDDMKIVDLPVLFDDFTMIKKKKD